MDKTYAQRLHKYELVLRGFFLTALRLQIKPYKDFFYENGYLGRPEDLIVSEAFQNAYIQSYRYITDAEMWPEWKRQEKDYRKSQKDFTAEDGFLIISETLKNFFLQAALTNYNDIRDEINGTTVSYINNFVSRGRGLGMNDEQIMRDLATAFDKDSRNRSILIGNTEANTILGLAKRETANMYFRQRGLTGYKTWFTRMDEKVRRTHVEVEHRTLPIDTPFTLNRPGGAGIEFADYPCDHTLSPGNRINCRCYCEYHSDPNKFKK